MSMVSNLTFIARLIRYKITGKRFPAHVAIAVTNRCNLKCSYCFARYNSRDSDDITTERLLALVDELASMGTRLINLTGGEPLLRKDIKTIIDYISSKGIGCSFSTNATFLAEKEEVLENVTSINISLDGTRQQHIANRGLQNYERILNAIRLATARGVPVSTCTVINRHNTDCVEPVVALAREMGFLAIFHIPYGRINDAENENYETMSREQCRLVMQKIIDLKNAGAPIYYSNNTHRYIRDWPYQSPGLMLGKNEPLVGGGFKTIACRAGDLYCFIDANGFIYPCTVICGQLPAKNFLTDGFTNAWNHVPSIRCKACSFFFQNELNQLLTLQPAVWWNFARTSLIRLY